MSISKKLRYLVLERDNYTCQYCGLSTKDGIKLEIDHKIPVSKGGLDIIDNLVVACFDCNRGKRDFIEYTKLPLENITPEIAHNILPIIKKMLFENMNENDFKFAKIPLDNFKKIMKRFNIPPNKYAKEYCMNKENNITDFGINSSVHEYVFKIIDLEEEYYAKHFIRLKSIPEHLEAYKKYHNLNSDKDVALKLIEDCVVPNEIVNNLVVR